VGNGIRLRMGLYDHYRDSHYFGYRLYDETKVKSEKAKNISYKTILGASCFLDGEGGV
jgi:hypothetical protein